jgi:Uma2 family endonuclease
MSERLSHWAANQGEVGTEWRFRIAPPGEAVRPLVPDIAYLSYERMGNASDDELEAPRIPPNIVIEIRSPEDQQAHLDHKVEVYLAAGVEVVLIIDPLRRTIIAHDAEQRRAYKVNDVFAHPALPGFTPAVSDLFKILQRPR